MSHVVTKLSAAIGAMLLAMPAPALAGEHLWPETSLPGQAAFSHRYPDADAQIDYYYATVVETVFQGAFAPGVVLRAIRANPRVAESAVGIVQDREGFQVFVLQSRAMLFRYAEIAAAKRGHFDASGRHVIDEGLIADYQRDVPLSPRDVAVARCEAPLDAALAARIEAVWDAMLRATRYEKRVDGEGDARETVTRIEGTAYHFSAGALYGQAYAPDPGSRTDMLAAVADDMVAYCHGKNDAALTRDVGALEQRLQREERP